MFSRLRRMLWPGLAVIMLILSLSSPLWAGEVLMSQAGFANWLQQATAPLQQKMSSLQTRSDQLQASIDYLEGQIIQEIVLQPGIKQVRISGPVRNDTQNLDVAPLIQNGRTLVPLRFIGEVLGAEVIWNDVSRQVVYRTNDRNIALTVNSKQAQVNGQAIELEVAPVILNGRTLVPLRFISEWMGAVVRWEGATNTILIRYFSGNTN
jgi:hypothetical protein